jgi:hypothetical protein
VLEYGVSFDSATTNEEASEMADEVESSCEQASNIESSGKFKTGVEVEGSGGIGAGGNSVAVSVGVEVEVEMEGGLGVDSSTTTTGTASTTTARSFATTISSSRTASTECAYECPTPSHLAWGVGTGASIEVNDPIGDSCPNDGGKQVYIWRWTGQAATVMPGESSEARMTIDTCHTQCTCTPAPPACAFSECADVWCTRCKK